MNKPADQTQRDQALDTSRSWIVQSPAGSGKTELLTQRYLKLLAQVSRPERVLAVTFTRKATLEMRQRIMDRLMQAAGKSTTEPEPHQAVAVELARRVLQQDQDQGWNLLQNPNRLRISTIDSFCADLASRQPLLAGNAWHLSVIENALPMYKAAAEKLLLDPTAGSGDIEPLAALERVLVFMEGKEDGLCDLLANMLGNRDQWAKPEAIGDTDLPEFEIALATIQQDILDKLIDTIGAQSLQEAIQWLDCIGTNTDPKTNPAACRIHELIADDSFGQELIIAHLACKALLTGAGKLRKPGGLKKQYGFPADTDEQADAVAGLRSLAESWAGVPEAITIVENTGKNIPVMPGSDGLALLDDLKLLLRNSLAYLNVEFDESGRCDFLSVSQAASQALGTENEPSDVLLTEDNRISHILMDEFQDTSRNQYALLKKLIAGWEPGDGRSLFLVGDPMQSIYGFREAEVGLFIRIWKSGHLGSVQVNKLTLQNNFRSNKEILEWVNDQFPQIFPASGNSHHGAVSYTPFLPHKGQGGGVETHLQGPGSDSPSEAELIASLIQSKVRDNPDESIAVLARSKKLLTPIARALLRLQVEFEAVDADPLELRPVVLDLMSLSRALSQPHDRVAWISLLRAPWCGLNLAEIHLLLGDDHSLPVMGKLNEQHINESLTGESVERVQKLREVMQDAASLVGIQPLSRRVEICWLRLGGPLAVMETSELDNAKTFFLCQRSIELEQVDDPIGELNRRLGDLFARNRQHCNVQLMSIHKAKGLEFDRVIVPGIEKGTGRGTDSPLVRWQRYPDGQTLIAPRNAWKYEGNSLYQFLKQEKMEREDYESQRVLYVAVTRARKHLHLLGSYKQGKSGISAPAKGSFLSLLWSVLEPTLEVSAEPVSLDSVDTPEYPLLRLKELPVNVISPVKGESAEPPGESGWHIPDPGVIAFGQALHLWLEIAHNNKGVDFSVGQLDIREPAMASTLLAFGAVESELADMLPRLKQALGNALGTQKGRDIVYPDGGQHSIAELGIRVENGMSLNKYVIDHIDTSTGNFTITDFKTGQADPNQKGKWRNQLAKYAELIATLTGETDILQQVYHPQGQQTFGLNDND